MDVRTRSGQNSRVGGHAAKSASASNLSKQGRDIHNEVISRTFQEKEYLNSTFYVCFFVLLRRLPVWLNIFRLCYCRIVTAFMSLPVTNTAVDDVLERANVNASMRALRFYPTKTVSAATKNKTKHVLR